MRSDFLFGMGRSSRPLTVEKAAHGFPPIPFRKSSSASGKLNGGFRFRSSLSQIHDAR